MLCICANNAILVWKTLQLPASDMSMDIYRHICYAIYYAMSANIGAMQLKTCIECEKNYNQPKIHLKICTKGYLKT